LQLTISPKIFFCAKLFMRMISLLRLFCPLLFLFPFFLFANPDLDVIHECGPFIIHCSEQDADFAAEAGKVLIKSYKEISYDFALDSAEHFQVYIMPTRKSFQRALRGELPNWTGAFAVPSQHLMVIKSPRWNSADDFNQVLIHELVHLVVHGIIGAHKLPRWIDEGMAIFYSGEDRWKTDLAVSKALTTNSILSLSEIDDVLEYHRAKADLAYQQSFSAVNYLLATYDIEALRGIIFSLKQGADIHQAFWNATGSDFADFEQEWRAYIEKSHRWLWIYEINEYIWGGILFLAIAAFVSRYIRNKRIQRDWRDESLSAEDDEFADS